jgi:pimeloyl-ACP methyl ester carboxylesterase
LETCEVLARSHEEAQEMCRHRQLAIVVLLALLVACAPAATRTPAPTATRLPTPSPFPTRISLPIATKAPTPAIAEGKVNVGDHDLAYRCHGSGSPTVIVEDGFGGAPVTGHDWDAVVNGVEPVTRICLYDRAPLGLSYAEIPVHTCEETADDLHSLLDSASMAGPFVLVGHSVGGLYVRYYAAKYPDRLVGIVLVEASPPGRWDGVLAVLGPESPGELEGVTQYRKERADFWGSSDGLNPERLNVTAALEQAAQLTSLGDMPLVVLSRSPARAYDDDANPHGLPTDLIAKLEQNWQDLQAEQSRLSTSGSLVVATKAAHQIHVEEPQLVIGAILKVVEEARKR